MSADWFCKEHKLFYDAPDPTDCPGCTEERNALHAARDRVVEASRKCHKSFKECDPDGYSGSFTEWLAAVDTLEELEK